MPGDDGVPGIAAAGVRRFFREQFGLAPDEPLGFALIGAGRSNLTVRVCAGDGRTWVLRRPPLGHVLPTAHDMAREYRVLRALAGTDVPVPRPLALCEDAAVTGAPFYVMEDRPGVVLEDTLAPGFADTPAARRRLSLAFADALVRLHAVDFRAAGLEDFGRPAGYLERQVRRWAGQWARSETAPLPAIDELARRLRAALPPSPPATIVHGDYRLGNVAFDPADPGRVVAVYDWEMSTLGDPLADLGYALVCWAEAGDPPVPPGVGAPPALTRAAGFLTRAELLGAYARATGRDVSAIEFHQVLALYKLAVISEGIYARHLQGKTVGAAFAGLTRAAGPLAERALAIADAAADPRLRGR